MQSTTQEIWKDKFNDVDYNNIFVKNDQILNILVKRISSTCKNHDKPTFLLVLCSISFLLSAVVPRDHWAVLSNYHTVHSIKSESIQMKTKFNSVWWDTVKIVLWIHPQQIPSNTLFICCSALVRCSRTLMTPTSIKSSHWILYKNWMVSSFENKTLHNKM